MVLFKPLDVGVRMYDGARRWREGVTVIEEPRECGGLCRFGLRSAFC